MKTLRHLVDGSPKNPTRAPLLEGLPMPRKLVQRRLLICRSAIGLDPIFIFVDDDDTCGRPDTRHAGSENNGYPLFHLFQMAGPFTDSSSRVCIRCPRSLDKGEWDRIVLDIPEGHGRVAANEWCLKHGRYRTRRYSSEPKEPGFTFNEKGE